MEHAAIIDALGGYTAIARALNVGPNHVWRWGIARAIPARRWPIIVHLAQQAGLPHITVEALLAGYEPAQQQLAADRRRMGMTAPPKPKRERRQAAA